MEYFTAVAHVLDLASVSYKTVLAVPKYPTPYRATLETYLNKVSGFWYHGSDCGTISEFKGNAFFAEGNIAATYGFDGFLYKVKLHTTNPIVLAENEERALSGAGSDTEMMNFIKNELFSGCSSYVLDNFDALYKQNGPDVPTRLFGDASSGEEWKIIAGNMQRLGFDSMLYKDESYTRQEVGFSVFLPEALGHVHIVDVAPLVRDKVPEGFIV